MWEDNIRIQDDLNLETESGRKWILFSRKKHYILEQYIYVNIKEKNITCLERGSEADHDVKEQKSFHGKKRHITYTPHTLRH